MNRSLTATLITLIDNVIMYKTCIVEQFEHDGRQIGGVSRHSELSCNQQKKDGTHLLATMLTNMFKNNIQKLVRMGQCLIKQAVEPVQIRFDGLNNMMQLIH